MAGTPVTVIRMEPARLRLTALGPQEADRVRGQVHVRHPERRDGIPGLLDLLAARHHMASAVPEVTPGTLPVVPSSRRAALGLVALESVERPLGIAHQRPHRGMTGAISIGVDMPSSEPWVGLKLGDNPVNAGARAYRHHLITFRILGD